MRSVLNLILSAIAVQAIVVQKDAKDAKTPLSPKEKQAVGAALTGMLKC
jgi:hypothetical protein